MPKRATRRRRSTAKKMMGGFGGADHAIATYGDMGSQRAIGGNNNAIAMKPMAGGKHKTNMGGSALTGLGVPSFLLAANELYKRRRTQGGKSRRGSRRYRK